MKLITVKIPNNLPKHEEIIEVAKHLARKAIQANDNPNLIGDGIKVLQDAETHIVIKRIPVKPIELIECSVCGNQFEKNRSKILHVNYGGTHRKKRYCSDDCRMIVFNLCGVGRAWIGKRKTTGGTK